MLDEVNLSQSDRAKFVFFLILLTFVLHELFLVLKWTAVIGHPIFTLHRIAN